MALIIGVVIVLLILFGFLCYKKAPPTEAIVVTGFGLARPKVVCGKGTFVLPVLQRADRLNMRLLKIDVKTPETGVKTQNGVSLWIDSVVTIQVYSENSTVLDEEVKASGLKDAKAYIMSRQQAAISNFLGMNEQGINDKVNDVLQGNLREIVSDMTVDQILTNRKQMALSVIENARPDLAKMGLEVVTFNVQDIRDAIDGQGHNHGVIEANWLADPDNWIEPVLQMRRYSNGHDNTKVAKDPREAVLENEAVKRLCRDKIEKIPKYVRLKKLIELAANTAGTKLVVKYKTAEGEATTIASYRFRDLQDYQLIQQDGFYLRNGCLCLDPSSGMFITIDDALAFIPLDNVIGIKLPSGIVYP